MEQTMMELPEQEHLSAYEQLDPVEQEQAKQYWRDYQRFVSGKTTIKPDKNEAIRKFWRLRDIETDARKRRDRLEFTKLQSTVGLTFKEPSKDMDMLNTRQLAEYFGVSTGTITSWIHSGWLPDAVQPWSPHGRWYVPSTSIEVMEARIGRVQQLVRRFYPRVLANRHHQGSQGK